MQPGKENPAIERFLEHCHHRRYPAKSVIIYAGDEPDVLYYIIKGSVTVLIEDEDGREIVLAYLNPGDFFGEMAIFEKQRRSATVRASGQARVLKIDKKTLLRRIREDPLLAVNLLKTMSHRIRELDAELSRCRGAGT